MSNDSSEISDTMPAATALTGGGDATPPSVVARSSPSSDPRPTRPATIPLRGEEQCCAGDTSATGLAVVPGGGASTTVDSAVPAGGAFAASGDVVRNVAGSFPAVGVTFTRSHMGELRGMVRKGDAVNNRSGSRRRINPVVPFERTMGRTGGRGSPGACRRGFLQGASG